jgi:hypothetical protein
MSEYLQPAALAAFTGVTVWLARTVHQLCREVSGLAATIRAQNGRIGKLEDRL